MFLTPPPRNCGFRTLLEKFLSCISPGKSQDLRTKGIVIAIADGMSSSEAGKEASHACVNGFINDYYSTPASWSVKKCCTENYVCSEQLVIQSGHTDLKPENIMISEDGGVKIIDFGSVKIAGIEELKKNLENEENILGTINYSAPEFYLGHSGGERSDLYSLAVITYELLNNHLPFGKDMPEKAGYRQLSQLQYVPSIHINPMVPVWIDGTIKKALSLDIKHRHEDVFEFLYDLKNPNPLFMNNSTVPLIERNPLLVWKSISALSLIINFILLYYLVK